MEYLPREQKGNSSLEIFFYSGIIYLLTHDVLQFC